MTLRRRLAWMVLALLLPSAGFFAWIVVATYHRETESAQRQLRETARALSLVVDRELDKRAAIQGNPASAMQNILVEQRLPAGWRAAVVDRANTVVARSPDPERWLGHKVPPEMAAVLGRQAEGFVETVATDGVPVHAFYSRSPVHGWTFVIGVPKPMLTAVARRAAWEAAAGAILVSLLGVTLAALAARTIRGPIVRLEAAARQLERDQLPDWPETGLAEADAVGAALRRAGMQSSLELTERQQALDELRRAEEAQRLLVRLHDATRGLHDPARVQWEIVNIVGRHFRASRCAYAEVDASLQSLTVIRDYVDGVESVAGRHALEQFGAAVLDDARRGRTLAVADVDEDPRTHDVRAAYAAVKVRALLCVPLRKSERLAAVLVLHQDRLRAWTADETTLLEQVAERCWYAVETARAEAALRESRDVLSLAMRSGRMGAWSRDMVSDRVWWSRELEEIFGLPPGGFGGRDDAFRRLVHPDDEPRLSSAVAEALSSRQDYTVEFRFRHASGEWRWMEGRGRAVYGDDGRAQMLYGLGIDISARKQAEDELRRLNAELSDADRRKDEFLATLAHELRNPLAPITNALEILRLKDPADPEMRWTRDVIDRQVRQMTRLVDDLLDVARITRGKIALRRERVALAAVVHGAVEAARPSIESSGHQLDVSLPTVPVWLDADPTRLTQVLLNLLNNAAKYTLRGGRVEVEARLEGREALVRVRDTGIGIASEHIGSVFEMFSQVVPALERSQGGLGIGLALARGLVELHGGSIEASSAGPGQGSEFVVRLPAVDAPAATDAVAAATVSGVSPLRVLVVDDNRDAADSLAVMLELYGHAVAIANDGPGALDAAGRFEPDVVLLDIGMPGMNGYEVAERLRQTDPGRRTMLVALTGWGADEDKRRAMAAGFDHHLTKPVDPANLEAVLEAGAGRR